MTAGSGYGQGPGAGRGQLRASATDRDRAVEVLAMAFAEGRLTADEHSERVGRAMTAATYADLDSVVAGLPSAHPAAAGVGGAYPVPRRTNPLAVASLVCGLAQIFFLLLATIPAIVLGHVARRQIRRSGEQGGGMALAGLLLGWAGMVLLVLVLVGGAIAFAVAAHGHPMTLTPHPAAP